jgi:hypothetical protein
VLLLSAMAAMPGSYLRKVEKQQEYRRGLEALSEFLRLRLKSPVENPKTRSDGTPSISFTLIRLGKSQNFAKFVAMNSTVLCASVPIESVA